MPELPEVETIRRSLNPRVCGRMIEQVTVGDRRVLREVPAEVVGSAVGQTIRRLQRRGKLLIFELDRHFLVFHLGMTGQLTFRDPERPDSDDFQRHPVTGLQRARQHPPDRHTHLQLHLVGGGAILFRDVRKFGRIRLLEREPLELQALLAPLGLEPLTPEYEWKAFHSRFRNRKLRVKSLLLDQGFVAGVGNIYADEALFEARVHPARTVRSLLKREKQALFDAIPRVLEKGISYGGTTLRDYVDGDGREGGHQHELAVYGRTGAPCLRCGAAIEKITISQRGTHFCPVCQPLRRPRGKPATSPDEIR